MVAFTAPIQKFAAQGEKTGWTYITVPENIASALQPGSKKTFRVKGQLDHYPISRTALLPMGGGTFILALNAALRKGIQKRVGELVHLQLEVDERTRELPAGFMESLADEPAALQRYNSLSKSHKGYFTIWLTSVKGEAARTKSIVQAVTGLAAGQDFVQLMQALKAKRNDFLA